MRKREQNQLLNILILSMTLSHIACNDDVVQPGPSDMGDHASEDMSPAARDTPQDLTDVPDATPSRCDSVVKVMGDFTLSYSEGVATEYEVAISPAVDTSYRNLTILFERYTFGADIGTFELGVGADENFGNCAHCVFMKGDRRDRAYFASEGTLVTRDDPYARVLDVQVKGLILIPVEVSGETRASTPIPDAGCVQVEDFSYQRIFPSPGWTCEPSRYKDGVSCDCECGAPDPDCNGPQYCLPGDQACLDAYEPLPLVGCEAAEQCVFNPETMGSICVASCSWKDRTACATGTCLYDTNNQGDLCVESPVRFVSARVGEPCLEEGEQSIFQLYCQVEDGFALGYCDPNDMCRAVCAEESECTEEGHSCRYFLGEEGLGYCGPEPTDEDG